MRRKLGSQNQSLFTVLGEQALALIQTEEPGIGELTVGGILAGGFTEGTCRSLNVEDIIADLEHHSESETQCLEALAHPFLNTTVDPRQT